MKRNIFFVFAMLFFSCNNNNDTTGNNSRTEIPAEEKQLREAITEHPDSLVLTENLVQYFRNNENYSQAIAETEKALQKDSINEKLWYMKATLLSENDDTTKAIAAWEKIIKISPRPEYLMSLGTLYAFTKDPLALAMGDLLMSPMGKSVNQGLFIKGLYYTNIGDKINAIAFFDKCLSLDYTNLLAYREKAMAEYDLGKYLEALKTLDLSLAVKKTYDEAYYWMGRCYEKLGKKEEAVDNYKMALQISPDYVEPKDALGKMGIVQ